MFLHGVVDIDNVYVSTIQVQRLQQPLNRHLTLGKLYDLSVPLYPPLLNGNNNTNNLKGWYKNNLTNTKFLE